MFLFTSNLYFISALIFYSWFILSFKAFFLITHNDYHKHEHKVWHKVFYIQCCIVNGTDLKAVKRYHMHIYKQSKEHAKHTKAYVCFHWILSSETSKTGFVKLLSKDFMTVRSAMDLRILEYHASRIILLRAPLLYLRN